MRSKLSSSSLKHSLGRPKDASKREDIIKAAQNLFMSEGYSHTSMEAVAKKADVSKLTIYSHFQDKDELFKEVVQQKCAKLLDVTNGIAAARGTVEESLTELGMHFAKMILNPDSLNMHRIMLAEADRHPRVVEIFYQAGPKRVRAAFGEMLKEWVEQRYLTIPDIPKAAEQFFSLLKGELMMKLMLGQAAHPSSQAVKKHVHATVEFFLAAYKP